uniref:Ulp1 protease family, C-terminal catalytic domain containing protein n=1 Tax=Solanum tuberosum TaxID=4113 RepID=M1CPK7_SOLTU
MTTAPVSHSTLKSKEKDEEEEEEEEKEKEEEDEEKEKVKDKETDKDDHYLANYSNLEFKQLDFVVASPKKKGWFYVMSQPNRYVYVPVNYNGEFHWVLAVVALKEWCIKVYDSMSSSRTNIKLCSEIQKLSTMLPKYLESSGFFEQKERTNWPVLETYQGKNKSHPLEVIHVIGIAQQASSSLLMRERHVRYPEYYDSTDRILDLNFYSNFKQRYDKMSKEATTVGGRSFTQLINEFEWDEDMINYVRGFRPYPGGMDWIGAKRIFAVMNLNKTHFVTLEILLHEGRLDVYDCQLMGMEHAKFLTFIQPVFELLPKLLKQSGIMKHLPDKFLSEPWEFEG